MYKNGQIVTINFCELFRHPQSIKQYGTQHILSDAVFCILRMAYFFFNSPLEIRISPPTEVVK